MINSKGIPAGNSDKGILNMKEAWQLPIEQLERQIRSYNGYQALTITRRRG